jgi:hypothetical protein
LPTDRAVIVDFVFNPILPFFSSEIYLGCGGNLRTKPYPTEYVNRFIELGARRHIIPGDGNTHEVDKHHLYHVKDPIRWCMGDEITAGFKMNTYGPGVFPVVIFVRGDEREGSALGLAIRVEEYPTTRMHCVRPDHAHMACAVGIQPRIPSS